MRAMDTRLPTRNLDLLRAIAVLCVLIAHLGLAVGLPSHGWDQLGRFGVMLFFVHTSLVLMGSLERQQRESSWVRSFYIRRAFRIYPLACVIVMTVVAIGLPNGLPLVNLPTNGVVTSGIRSVVSNFLLVQNLSGSPNVLFVLWTLPLEVQMYAGLPLLFLIARRGLAPAALLMAGALLASWSWLLLLDDVRGLWRLTLMAFAPCFVAGILAFALFRVRRHTPIPASAWPIILAGLVAGAMGLGWSRGAVFRQWDGWIFCLVVGLVLPFTREMRESKVTRAAATVATYSYSIYLLHVPVFALAFRLTQGAWGGIAVVAAIALLFPSTWLAYQFIEKPSIELGRAIAARPRRANTLVAVS